MTNYTAQFLKKFGGNIRGSGPLGLEGKLGSSSLSIFDFLLSSIIGIMTVIAAVYFAFLLISGAIGIITSSGDIDVYGLYRQRITAGLVGLTIILAGIFIIRFLGNLLGVPSILQPASIIVSLRSLIQ